jgi:RNA polymerase sigma-70 factor (ECF subfamily)
VKTPTDEQLLAEVVQGRSDAFELLVRRHAGELYRFVLRYTNNSVAAEDVAQDSFLQAYVSAASFDPKRRFRSWLFTIAANKARDWLRKRARHTEVSLDAQTDESLGPGTLADLLASENEMPEDTLEINEQRRLVRRVVDDMPSHLREILVLSYYHHFRYRELAEILDVPLGTVKSRLHAAVAHFGRAYQTALEESGD